MVPTCKAQRPKKWVELVLRPQQSTLRADAKPFNPQILEDVHPSLDMETRDIMASADYTHAQEFMQQLHDSLNRLRDWNNVMQKERKAAAPCLHVPCSTPTSAFYSQDNSPCNS